MAIGFNILEKREHMAHELSAKLAKTWIFAEIILFSMVGAQVNIEISPESEHQAYDAAVESSPEA